MSCWGRIWWAFKSRKRFSNLKQIPVVIIAIGAICCAAESSAILYILKDVGPSFMEASKRVRGWADFGVAGAASTVMMTGLFISAWFFGVLGRRCLKELEDRIFP